jgi:hypothetical protein
MNLPSNTVCRNCGRTDKFSYNVPDGVWARVVPSHLRDRVVCLDCFDSMAAKMNVPYARYIKSLFFAGQKASLEFQAVAAVTVQTKTLPNRTFR